MTWIDRLVDWLFNPPPRPPNKPDLYVSLAEHLKCKCPPWWQSQNRPPEFWYSANVIRMVHIIRHTNCIYIIHEKNKTEYKWKIEYIEFYVKQTGPKTRRLAAFPIIVGYDPLNYPKLYNFMFVCPSNINKLCGLGHGCCVICKSTEYSSNDRERMRESRAELHAELLAYVWHPCRMARMMA